MKKKPDVTLKNTAPVTGRFVIREWQEGQIKYKTELVKTPDGRILSRNIVDKESMKGLVPTREIFSENTVVSSDAGYGANLILRQMMNDTAYPIVIDEVCFGLDATTPTSADIALGNETVNGIGLADMNVVNNVLTIDIFVPSLLMPVAVYKEIGLKMDGRLFTHGAMDYSKTVNKDTTIEYIITINV